MNIVLDTNRYVDLSAGDADVLQRVQDARSVFLTFITIAELRAGFVRGTRGRHNEQTLVRFLNSPRVGVLFPDDRTTHHYAELYRQPREQGTPVPTNDVWIAALTLQHGLMLYTRDKHFDALPQIARI